MKKISIAKIFLFIVLMGTFFFSLMNISLKQNKTDAAALTLINYMYHSADNKEVEMQLHIKGVPSNVPYLICYIYTNNKEVIDKSYTDMTGGELYSNFKALYGAADKIIKITGLETDAYGYTLANYNLFSSDSGITYADFGAGDFYCVIGSYDTSDIYHVYGYLGYFNIRAFHIGEDTNYELYVNSYNQDDMKLANKKVSVPSSEDGLFSGYYDSATFTNQIYDDKGNLTNASLLETTYELYGKLTQVYVHYLDTNGQEVYKQKLTYGKPYPSIQGTAAIFSPTDETKYLRGYLDKDFNYIYDYDEGYVPYEVNISYDKEDVYLTAEYGNDYRYLTIKCPLANIDDLEITAQKTDSLVYKDKYDNKKIGYTFSGYSLSNDNVAVYPADYDFKSYFTSPLQKATFYCCYEANEYTVTVTGLVGEDQEFKRHTDETLTYDFLVHGEKEGYTFKEWLYENQTELPSIMPANDIVITATWEANPYTIYMYYQKDGENYIEADLFKTYVYKTDEVIDASLLADPGKTGYTFTGWTPTIPETMPANDIYLVANWEIKKCSIIFDSDGGTSFEAITADYQTPIVCDYKPTKDGYKFIKWDPAIPETMPGDDITIKAIYEEYNFNIICKLENGEDDKVYVVGHNTIINCVEDPTKTHYTFKGWDTTLPERMPEHDITITATWEIHHLILSILDAKNGEEYIAKYDYGATIVLPTFTKDHYTFVKLSETLPETMPDNDIQVSALWEINKYKVIFDTDGGEEMETLVIDYKGFIPEIKDPVKKGYTFKGWDQTLPTFISDEDITLKAIWEINHYTLIFIVDDIVYSKVTYEYNQKIEVPADPVLEAYIFEKWDQALPVVMGDSDLVIRAVLKIKTYQVTFKNSKMEVLETKQINHGDKVTKVSEEFVRNYEFEGWYIDFECLNAYDFDTPVTSTLTLYPKYQEISKRTKDELTLEDKQIKLEFSEGIYNNALLVSDYITNEELDTASFITNYSKILNEYEIIGAVYSFKLVQYDETISLDSKVSYTLVLPENVKDKNAKLIHVSLNGESEEITYNLVGEEVTFDATGLGEFAFIYELEHKDPFKMPTFVYVLGGVLLVCLASFGAIQIVLYKKKKMIE